MRTVACSCLCLAALGLQSACGDEELDVPVAPDLAPINAVYDAPTGTLDLRDVRGALDELETRAALIRPLLNLLVNATDALRERLEASGQPTDPATTVDDDDLLVDAVVRVDRTCRGWDSAATVPDPATNGTAQLTAVVQDSVLAPTVWGTMDRCRGRVDLETGSTNAYAEGTFAVYLYGGLPQRVEDAHFLVRFDGKAGGEGSTPVELAADFRVAYPQIEVRLPVDDGDVIFSIGLEAVGVRARNGSFGCSLSARSCGAEPTDENAASLRR